MSGDATFRTLDRLCRELEDAQNLRSIKIASPHIQEHIGRALDHLTCARQEAAKSEATS